MCFIYEEKGARVIFHIYIFPDIAEQESITYVKKEPGTTEMEGASLTDF